MAIEREPKDFKTSPSLLGSSRSNRSSCKSPSTCRMLKNNVLDESKIMDRNTNGAMEANGYRANMTSKHTLPTSDADGSPTQKKKMKFSEFEMWKHAYSLVKNGYSILAPEPSQRSRSYRDLILQEMNWMAVDYYQERRWKTYIAKEITNSINSSNIDRKRLKRDWPAKQCSYNVEVFWLKVKENGENTPISLGLHEYCQRMVAGKTLNFNSPDIVEEVPTKKNDLLAITIPVYRHPDSNAVHIAKTEVFNATMNHMRVLGAELYPQSHRPPDDEIDVFTLPALNPRHDFDYNTLMLLLHSLKGNMLGKMTKQEHQSLMSSVNANRNYITQQHPASMAPIRRIPRDEIDPFSLSVNYRESPENAQGQPTHAHKLVLKWEEPTPNEGDFEILESWMLESKCWPLISIAVNMRTGSGGLLRTDYSPKACKEAFYKIENPPRGQVTVTKKLLGPKQNKSILSFLDAAPVNFRFKAIVPSASTSSTMKTSEPAHVKLDHKETGMKTLFGDVARLYPEETKMYTISTSPSGKKEGLFGRFKFSSEPKNEKRLYLKEVASQKPDAFVVPENVKVEMLCTNPKLSLPYDLAEFVSYDGNMEQYNKKQKQSHKRSAEEAELDSDGNGKPPKPKYMRYSDKKYSVITRYSVLNSVVTLATTVTSHDNVVRNAPYSDLATRMNKQLRIGFLGIPTKMFVYSLFYSGRVKRDFKVRRVAFSVSSISKFVPPPHLLYGKMFDPEVNAILTKSRPTYEKQRTKSTETQESFTTELLQNYINEVSTYTNTKPDETNVPELLAMYTQVALSKGQTCNQGCFSNNKIMVSLAPAGSAGNTTNSSSTPTERRRTHVSSIESTPRQRARQVVEHTPPADNPPSYRTRQETMMRRQMVHTPNMHPIHPYQQMQMMYPMPPQMNQQMAPMNHPMGNMGQPMNVVNMNQPMNYIGQPINNMGQPVGNMNQMINGKMMYNMQNPGIPHYQEDETF